MRTAESAVDSVVTLNDGNSGAVAVGAVTLSA